jgi:hypothetical protein
MRGRDDRAAANQRATNPLHLARLRAIQECEGRLIPQAASRDELLVDGADLEDADTWDPLKVDYLFAEWPASRLN